MKVRVEYTAEITDVQRRALGRYLDDYSGDSENWSKKDRLATRAEIADFYRAVGYENGEGVLDDYIMVIERPPPPPPMRSWVTFVKDPRSGDPIHARVLQAPTAKIAGKQRFGEEVMVIKTRVVRPGPKHNRTIGWVVPRTEKTT